MTKHPMIDKPAPALALTNAKGETYTLPIGQKVTPCLPNASTYAEILGLLAHCAVLCETANAPSLVIPD